MDTPDLAIPYPDEYTDPYFSDIQGTFNETDAWILSNVEDKSLVVTGGGTMSLVGDTFTWTAPLYVHVPWSGVTITINASNITVTDGESLYVSTATRPITTQTLSLNAGTPSLRNHVVIGFRVGSTVFLGDAQNGTLDDAYDASGGPATIEVDAGDVTWDFAGAYSFNVDLENTTGTADGFQVYDTVDEYWRIVRKADAALDLEAQLQNVDYDLSGSFTIDGVDQSTDLLSVTQTPVTPGTVNTVAKFEAVSTNWDTGSKVVHVVTADGDAVPFTVTNNTNNRFDVQYDGVVHWGQDITTPTNAGFLSWDTGRAIVGGMTGIELALYASGEKVRIDTSGNMGVGIFTGIGARVDIKSSGTSSNAFRIENSADTDALLLVQEDSGGDARLYLYDDGANVGVRLGAAVDSYFMGGKVGIGIDTPDTLLHVESGTAGTVTPIGNTKLTVEADNTAYISILTPDANERGIIFGEPTSNVAGGVIYNTATNADGLQFRVNGNTPAIDIESDGTLHALTTDYENLVTHDDDIPNKKYVDDAISVEDLWDRSSPYTYLANAGDTVGIGVSDPDGKLTIKSAGLGSTPFRIERSANGNTLAYLYEDADGDALYYLYDKTNNVGVRLHTAGLSYINGSGNNLAVGSDTDTGHRFQVWVDSDTVYSAAAIPTTQGALIYNNGDSLTDGMFSSLVFRVLSNTSNSLGAINLVQPLDTSTGSEFAFQLRNDSAAYFEAMRIDKTGQVGIGLDPAAMLDIKSSGTASNVLRIENSANTNALLLVQEDSGGDARLHLYDDSGNVRIRLGAAVHSWVNGLNFGVGSSTDSGHKFQVYVDNDNQYSAGSVTATDAMIYNLSDGALANEFSSLRLQTSSDDGTTKSIGVINLIQPTSSAYGSEFAFQLRNDGGNYFEAMRIKKDGDIGFGTDDPPYSYATLGASARYVSIYAGSVPTALELGTTTSTDGNPVGVVQWTNKANADYANNDADGRIVAQITTEIETTDGNADDDSGGHWKVYTKPEAGSLTERFSIAGSGLIVGGAGSPTYVSGNGALLVESLEVKGNSYLLGNTYHDGDVGLLDDFELVFGTGSDSIIVWDTSQTPNSWMFGTSSESNALIIAEKADIDASYDFSHGLQTNPTLYIHSANQSGTEYIAFRHNATEGVVTTGAGPLKLTPATYVRVGTGTPQIVNTAGELFVTNRLEVGTEVHTENVHIRDLGTATYGRFQFVADDGLHLGIGWNDGFANRNFMLVDYANISDDYDHQPASSHPTFIIHSATAAAGGTDQYMSLYHTTGGAYVSTGAAPLYLQPSNVVIVGSGSGSSATGAGDLYVQDAIEASGAIYANASVNISDDTSWLQLSAASGANIELYGSTHGSQANNAFYDANVHTFRSAAGASTSMTLTPGTSLLAHVDTGVGVSGAPQGRLEVREDQDGAPTRLIINNNGNIEAGTGARLSFYYGTTEAAFIEYNQDGSGDMEITNNGSGEIIITTGQEVQIGSNTTSHSIGAGSLLVSDALEADGIIYADGGIDHTNGTDNFKVTYVGANNTTFAASVESWTAYSNKNIDLYAVTDLDLDGANVQIDGTTTVTIDNATTGTGVYVQGVQFYDGEAGVKNIEWDYNTASALGVLDIRSTNSGATSTANLRLWADDDIMLQCEDIALNASQSITAPITMTFSEDIQIAGDKKIYSNVGQTGSIVLRNQYQTYDAMTFHTGTESGQILITAYANWDDNYAHAQSTNPTFIIHSATAAATATNEYVSIYHAGTGQNGYITTGTGNLSLQPATYVRVGSGTPGVVSAAGEMLVSGDLEVRKDQDGAPTRLIINNDGNVEAGTGARLSFYYGTTEAAFIEYNQDGSGDMEITNNGSGEIVITTGGEVQIGAGSPTLATGAGDLYVSSDAEIDGILYADGGITITDDTSGLDIAAASGANIHLRGSTHATQANQAYYDATLHTFRDEGGSTASLTITPGTSIVAADTIYADGDIINSSGVLTLNPVTYTRIGNVGTTSHSLGADDLLASGDLEVDGVSYFDGTATFYSSVTVDASMKFTNDNPLRFGTAPNCAIEWNTDGGTDSWRFGVDETNRTLVVCDYGDMAEDFGLIAFSHPTIVVHDASTTDENYFAVQHDGTDYGTAVGSGSSYTNHMAPVSLADDGTFDLPGNSAGWINFVVGDMDAYGIVYWDTSEVVTLGACSSNVTNADTDAYFCLFDNTGKVTVKNRLGAAKKVMFDYHFTTSPT